MKLNRSDGLDRYAKAILGDTALVACWPLDQLSGSLIRDIRKGNNSSAVSNITNGAFGPIDGYRCTTFSGSTSYIRVPDATDLDLGDGPLSIELWFKRGATGAGGNGYIFSKGSFGGGHRYIVYFNSSNSLIFGTAQDDSSIVSVSSTITDTAGWHHAVFTKTSSTRAAYLDGVVNQSLGTNQTMTDSTTQLSIGEESGGGTCYTGGLAWLALYKRVLTPTDVKLHYTIGRGG